MSKRFFTTIFLLLVSFCSKAQQCDGADEPELVRVYFVNGMMNSPAGYIASRQELEKVVGNTPQWEYRSAINISERFDKQLYELIRQRMSAVSPTKFWDWYNNPTAPATPREFTDMFTAQIMSASNSEYNSDSDLRSHVDQYVQDLRAGKKVVLVAHSQGNFYANNAYNYIRSRFPVLVKGIGVVGIGTPTSYVAGGGAYTQNSKDKILNAIERSTTFDVLNPNVDIEGLDFANHGFITTYLLHESARIASDITATVARLETLPIDADCDENIAVVETLPADQISHDSARLRANLLSGKNADAWFIFNQDPSKVICDGTSSNGFGAHTAPTLVGDLIAGLEANKIYYYKACAKGSIGPVSDGGFSQFVTKREAPVVRALDPIQIKHSYVTLAGELVKGIGVDMWVVVNRFSAHATCDGAGFDGTGNYTATSTYSFEVQKLEVDTKYFYRVCAKSADGLIAESSLMSVTTEFARTHVCRNGVAIFPTNDIRPIVLEFVVEATAFSGYLNYAPSGGYNPTGYDIFEYGTKNRLAYARNLPATGADSSRRLFIGSQTKRLDVKLYKRSNTISGSMLWDCG